MAITRMMQSVRSLIMNRISRWRATPSKYETSIIRPSPTSLQAASYEQIRIQSAILALDPTSTSWCSKGCANRIRVTARRKTWVLEAKIAWNNKAGKKVEMRSRGTKWRIELVRHRWIWSLKVWWLDKLTVTSMILTRSSTVSLIKLQAQ